MPVVPDIALNFSRPSDIVDLKIQQDPTWQNTRWNPWFHHSFVKWSKWRPKNTIYSSFVSRLSKRHQPFNSLSSALCLIRSKSFWLCLLTFWFKEVQTHPLFSTSSICSRAAFPNHPLPCVLQPLQRSLSFSNTPDSACQTQQSPWPSSPPNPDSSSFRSPCA